VSNGDANGRGRRRGPQAEAVERGRQAVAEQQDLAVPLAELRAQRRRVRCVLVGLLRTPDARRNVWTPTLCRILRELADDDAAA
jgi:hypothetical protein